MQYIVIFGFGTLVFILLFAFCRVKEVMDQGVPQHQILRWTCFLKGH